MEKIGNIGGSSASSKAAPINVGALDASKLAQSLGNPVLSAATETSNAAKEFATSLS